MFMEWFYEALVWCKKGFFSSILNLLNLYTFLKQNTSSRYLFHSSDTDKHNTASKDGTVHQITSKCKLILK